jgi:hypothetical protein
VAGAADNRQAKWEGCDRMSEAEWLVLQTTGRQSVRVATDDRQVC